MCQIVGQVLWGFTYKQGISAPGAFIMDTAEASLDSPVHSLCCHPACTEMMLRHGPCAHQGHSPGFRSVQFRCSVVSDSLWPHGLQHCQASLSVTNSRSLLKLMSIELVMPSNHLILCRPLLLLPSIFPSIMVFSDESVLRIRWPKYWSFSFSISPSNQHPGLISFRVDWLEPLAVQGTLKSLLQHHSSKASILRCSVFFIVQFSHPYMTTGKSHSVMSDSAEGTWNFYCFFQEPNTVHFE